MVTVERAFYTMQVETICENQIVEDRQLIEDAYCDLSDSDLFDLFISKVRHIGYCTETDVIAHMINMRHGNKCRCSECKKKLDV